MFQSLNLSNNKKNWSKLMDIKKEIGSRIKAIRKAKGYTQEQLAELVGIEPPSLSYIETGKFAPSSETLQNLSEVLNVAIWEFYYFENISKEKMIETLSEAMAEDDNLTRIFYNLYMSIKFNKKF